jgi:hypothetical protein
MTNDECQKRPSLVVGGRAAVDHSLALSLDQLLCTGGDTRLDIDPKTGRNRYACQSRPGRIVPFGSCTSSTVSPRGFAAARETQRQILSACDSNAFANECTNTMRRRLGEMLRLPDDVDIAFGPSGTDVEMLALALAAGGYGRPVMNILVGPGEVGSGTPQAAACRHYDPVTPNGVRVTSGEPVDAALAAVVRVCPVELRTASGAMMSESEIDAAVIELVLEASEQDAIVLLHIVAHSKTGVHAPSLACVERLRTASDDVVVVVDAAQGRFSRRGLRDVLERDYMVIFTGSKFYGGPPFSGALLVPPKFRPTSRRLGRLPEGFGAYFTAAEMPETWDDVRRALPAEPNVGGLLRWSAALAEMEAYYAVPSDLRLRVLRFFEAEVPRVFGESPCIRMLPVFPPVYEDTVHRLLESKTTVFGFWVTPPGAQKPLGKAELKQMHYALSCELTATDAGMNRDCMLQEYHLGQPVELGPAGCVLRVALGGELITRVAMDRDFGETFDERLAWLRGQLFGLRRKIECLAQTHAPATVMVPSVGALDASWSTFSPVATP